MKKRGISTLFAAVMALFLLPAMSAQADTPIHDCGNVSGCTVCAVAEMINALPEADAITFNNAAAVIEQIHAIDRVKVKLDTDTYDENNMNEYDHLLTLVENAPPASGYGINVPIRYEAVVQAVNNLTNGGSLLVKKIYLEEGMDLNRSRSNAVFTIESVDGGMAPLQITLADINNSALSGFYSADSAGWTNKYILPAGTYKITETGYKAVTTTGKHLLTTPTYQMGSEVREDFALVTVVAGQESSVSVLNNTSTTPVTVVFQDENGTAVPGGKLQLGSEYTFDSDNDYSAVVNDLINFEDPYTVQIDAPDGYEAPDVTGLTFMPNSGEMFNTFIDGVEAVRDAEGVTITVTLTKRTYDVSVRAFYNTTPLQNAKLQILEDGAVVEEWTTIDDVHVVRALDSGVEYILRTDAAPEGYLLPDDITFTINADGSIETDGSVTASGVLLVRFTRPQIPILAVDAKNTDSILEGVRLKVTNSIGEVAAEWTTAGATFTLDALDIDENYTVTVTKVPDGYIIPGSINFSIDENGRITTDGMFDEGVLLIACRAVDRFYIPLLSKTLVYGEPFGGSVIDFANVTLNGEPFSSPYIGQAFYLICTDAGGKSYDTKNGALIPVGSYTLTAKANVESEEAEYDFGEPVEVTVLPKPLTEDMFTVTAVKKVYDGTTDAKLRVTIRKEDPAKGISGIEIKGYSGRDPVYDDVEAVISGAFEDAQIGNDKTVTYTITDLKGKDAGNYVLPEGGIRGTLNTGVISDGTVPDTGDHSQILLWYGVLLVSGVAIIGLMLGEIKRRRASKK